MPEGTPGAVWLRGRVLDGAGEPVTDALVETWQADPAGRFDHPDDPRGAAPPSVPGFRGFGRSETRRRRVGGPHRQAGPGPGRRRRAAGAARGVSVFARGLLDRVVTRLYFADEEQANAEDAVLAALPDDAARRHPAGPAGRRRLPARPGAAGER